MILHQGFLACLLLASPAFAEQFRDQSGFNAAGPPGYFDETRNRFAIAARNPLVNNSVSFPGFDFNISQSAGVPSTLRLNSNWTLELGYSAVDVTDIVGSNTSQLVSDLTYDFIFPNVKKLPAQDDTEWTLCGYFLMSPFPSNLTSRYADETGDCSATLGQECLDAYQSKLLTSQYSGLGNSSCSEAPFWSEIPECVSQIGTEFSMASSSLMFEGGLYSTNPIFYQSSQSYLQSETSNYFNQYANAMRMAVFTFQNSRRWLDANPDRGFSREVQFTCTTANPDPGHTSGSVMNISPFSLMMAIAVATALLQF